jgi:DegV family protein with EDD domain
LNHNRRDAIQNLLRAARGNSGNIAAMFFAGFLGLESLESLLPAAQKGRELAWQAVHNPQKGTMLSVFDALVEVADREKHRPPVEFTRRTLDHLKNTVKSTPKFLPRLQAAGVVDSGALGMFLYLEAFFYSLAGVSDGYCNVVEEFKDGLTLAPDFKEEKADGYCVDMVLKIKDPASKSLTDLTGIGDSAVVIPDKDFLKIHFHTGQPEAVRKKFESFGEVMRWTDNNLESQINAFKPKNLKSSIHIVTDGAASVTARDSRNLGFTILDADISAGERSLPESLFTPDELYALMRKGCRVTTSQTSVFGRHQSYQRIMDQYERVLYLCVGSVFTGNYHVASEWRQKYDPDHRFIVVDTAAASGRLGIIVLTAARLALEEKDPKAVLQFAEWAIGRSEEFIFLDTLKYLAAGGRLSKTSAFFGNLLHLKPVVSPTAEGVKKIGMVRNRQEQLEFACDRLAGCLPARPSPIFMLEYSDNRLWVESVAKKEIERRYPRSEIICRPLSLTTGVHTGPGTWAISYMPGMA